jgi:hypothetical protein
VIDHCSVSWAIDENVTFWYAPHNITIQWCIISEALNRSLNPRGDHSKGMLTSLFTENLSVHHCLFAHNVDRNPLLRGNEVGGSATSEFINNVVYNWGWYATRLTRGVALSNIIGNYYKIGPNTGTNKGITVDALSKGTLVYVSGNVGPGRLTDTGDDWLAVNGSTVYRSLTAITPSGIVPQPAMVAYNLVLKNAGAIAPRRDSVDTRIIQEVTNGTGRWIDSQNQVGGWPILAAGTPPTDTDHDGMPNVWETARGLNPNNRSDGSQDRNGDGYTNVEEYLNSLIPWIP